MSQHDEPSVGGMEGQILEPHCPTQEELEGQLRGVLHDGSTGRSEKTLANCQASGDVGFNATDNEEAQQQHVGVVGQSSQIDVASEDLQNVTPNGLNQSESGKSQELHTTLSASRLEELTDVTPSVHISQKQSSADDQYSVGVKKEVSIKQEGSQKIEDPKQAVTQSNTQQTTALHSADSATRKAKSMPTIPFQMLIPILRAHLDKDKDMQLQDMWAKLRKNEVSKEDFLKIIRHIVGDQTLRQAAQKVHSQIQSPPPRTAPVDQNANQYSMQSQVVSQPISSSGPRPVIELQAQQPFSVSPNEVQKSQALHPAQNYLLTSAVHLQTGRPNTTEVRGMPAVPSRAGNINAMSTMQLGMQQQHSQFSQMPNQMYGVSNINPRVFPRPVNPTPAPFRPQISDAQARPVTHLPAAHPTAGAFGQNMPVPSHVVMQQNSASWQMQASKELRPNSFPPVTHSKQEQGPSENDAQPSRGTTSLPLVAAQTNHILSTQGIQAESSVQVMPTAQTIPTSTVSKTPQKRPSVGQKKPLDGGASSQASKKQKTSGADQTIEQLNDVTAVSGVDLREEEEQLFSAKDESRISEAARRVVQEEEERFILQKAPLHRKLLEITSKCNLKSINSDVERCLSMCVEERLRSVVTSLIRLSKQRMDAEKSGHRFVITSDVRRQILNMNRKAKEEWEKKQAEEAEKNRKTNEVDATTGTDTEKDKDDGRPKNVRVNREEDDKMRTTAANVAARAAVGGADLLSKWQLMAENMRQKREGIDNPSGAQAGRVVPARSSQDLDKGSRRPQAAEKRGQMTGVGSGGGGAGMRGPGRFASSAQLKAARSISVKDVISVLEREPQMAKSPLLYRLYNRLPGESSTD